MTTYLITGPFSARVSVNDDSIITVADPLLEWTIGHDREWFCALCHRYGWVIQPLPDDPGHVVEVDYDGAVYEFHWVGNRLHRITRTYDSGDAEDITTRDLPPQVRELID